MYQRIIIPAKTSISRSVELNVQLWTRDFNRAWDTIPLMEKIIWLMFVSYTVSALTLLELLFLKK